MPESAVRKRAHRPGQHLTDRLGERGGWIDRDLNRRGFTAARARTAARMTATVMDLHREIPNIRAFALRRWHETSAHLTSTPNEKAALIEERNRFWDWALLELLLTSGLRVEEADELTTLDILQRQLPDGRIYYLLHIKPSKCDRARVILIGDGLGRVIAEIASRVKAFYWKRRPSLRSPRLHLQGPIADSALFTPGCGTFVSDIYPDDTSTAAEPFVIDGYRAAMRGLYTDIYDVDALKAPTADEWVAFTGSCNLRDMSTHVCALPAGEHCSRGLVCLRCHHAQPKKSAATVFRRMIASHTRSLDKARSGGEPAGQIAARELEVERLRSARRRAEELDDDVAIALESVS